MNDGTLTVLIILGGAIAVFLIINQDIPQSATVGEVVGNVAGKLADGAGKLLGGVGSGVGAIASGPKAVFKGLSRFL